jgi:hypothetical protein
LSLAVGVVGHIIWFRFGWEDLPLRCYDNQGLFNYGWQELSGELRPQVADSLEAMLRALYGEAAIRRSGPGRIEVRPAVIYFDDSGRLADLTTLLTYDYGHGRPATGERSLRESDCRFAQHHLMEGSQARSCADPWEPHIYGIIAQDSWPWLTHVLEVRQPAVGSVDELATLAPTIRTTGPPRLASRTVPGAVYCDLRFEYQPLYFVLSAFGDVPIRVIKLWRSWTSE